MRRLEKVILISMLASGVVSNVAMAAPLTITEGNTYNIVADTNNQLIGPIEVKNTDGKDVNLNITVSSNIYGSSVGTLTANGNGKTVVSGDLLHFNENAITNSSNLTINNGLLFGLQNNSIAMRNLVGASMVVNGNTGFSSALGDSQCVNNQGVLSFLGDKTDLTVNGPSSTAIAVVNEASGNLLIDSVETYLSSGSDDKGMPNGAVIKNDGKLEIKSEKVVSGYNARIAPMVIRGDIYHDASAITNISLATRPATGLSVNLNSDSSSAGSLTLPSSSENLSQFFGAIHGSNDNFKLELKDTAAWYVCNQGEEPVTGISLLNNSIIDINQYNFVVSEREWQPFEKLILNNFKSDGSGIIMLSADLANNVGDNVTFTGTTPTGNLNVFITNKDNNGGVPIKREDGHSVTVVTAPSDTQMVVQSATGFYKKGTAEIYRSIIDEEINGGVKNWNFVGWGATGESKNLQDNVDANEAYIPVREVETVLKRLGDLHNDPSEVGVWMRGETGKTKINSYNYSYNIMSGGYDWTRENKAGNLFAGLGLSYSKNTCDTNIIGDTKSLGVNLYGSWLGKKNHDYVDLIIKRGRLSKDYDGFDGYGIHVAGTYDKNVTTFSTRYGRRFDQKNKWYLEPSIGFTYGIVEGADFVDNQGMRFSSDSVNSEVASLGIQVGKNVKGTEFYGKVQLMHDFGGKMKIAIPGTNIMAEDDMGGTWTKLTLGASRKVNSRNSFYFDLGKDFGNKVEKPWSISAGYRYTW